MTDETAGQIFEDDIGDFLPGSPMAKRGPFLRKGRLPPKKNTVAQKTIQGMVEDPPEIPTSIVSDDCGIPDNDDDGYAMSPRMRNKMNAAKKSKTIEGIDQKTEKSVNNDVFKLPPSTGKFSDECCVVSSIVGKPNEQSKNKETASFVHEGEKTTLVERDEKTMRVPEKSKKALIIQTSKQYRSKSIQNGDYDYGMEDGNIRTNCVLGSAEEARYSIFDSEISPYHVNNRVTVDTETGRGANTTARGRNITSGKGGPQFGERNFSSASGNDGDLDEIDEYVGDYLPGSPFKRDLELPAPRPTRAPPKLTKNRSDHRTLHDDVPDASNNESFMEDSEDTFPKHLNRSCKDKENKIAKSGAEVPLSRNSLTKNPVLSPYAPTQRPRQGSRFRRPSTINARRGSMKASAPVVISAGAGVAGARGIRSRSGSLATNHLPPRDQEKRSKDGVGTDTNAKDVSTATTKEEEEENDLLGAISPRLQQRLQQRRESEKMKEVNPDKSEPKQEKEGVESKTGTLPVARVGTNAKRRVSTRQQRLPSMNQGGVAMALPSVGLSDTLSGKGVRT